MEFFEAVKSRASYRDSFKDQAVPRGDLIKIVEAGIQAPSGMNCQTTSFIIVDDAVLCGKIAEILNNSFCRTAPAFIVCVVDKSPVFNGTSFYREDCAAATENILLALTDLGYRSVWLDGVLKVNGIAERIAGLLKVPEDRFVQIILPVGVPVNKIEQKEKLTFEKRAFFNTWNGK